jgi:hypothetical protein
MWNSLILQFRIKMQRCYDIKLAASAQLLHVLLAMNNIAGLTRQQARYVLVHLWCVAHRRGETLLATAASCFTRAAADC